MNSWEFLINYLILPPINGVCIVTQNNIVIIRLPHYQHHRILHLSVLKQMLKINFYSILDYAKKFLKQYNDSIKIIGSTKKPDVFFYRYDFAIKRAIALIYMKKRIRMTGDDPVKLADSLIEHKQEFTRQFIDRANSEITEKINKLKTVASKQKNIDAFENSFKPFYDEISPENTTYIQQIVTRLRQSIK